MAYVSKTPSLAKGGTLVKKDGRRIKGGTELAPVKPRRKTPTPDPDASDKVTRLSVEWFMENWGLNDWNERGWNGGGQMPIRNLVQKTRPSKSRHHCTRRAHPSLLKG